MTKLSARPPRPPRAPIRSMKGRKPDTLTHEGGAGFAREAKSELFLLAVTNMVGEDTFYEAGAERDTRFRRLVRQVAGEDPDWVARFVPYLRDTMNMRSASVVAAAELVHARLAKPTGAGSITNRAIIASALHRADEPAEMLGYWMSEWGRSLPQPVKRGVADAVRRLYNERSAIKYDGGDKAIRFGDVIELVHPVPAAPWQSALFRYLLEDRHGRASVDFELRTIAANRAALELPADEFRWVFSAPFVDAAGLTWEQASSKYGALDARFWEAMIPNMGLFALLRNLRNFEEAGISASAQQVVRARLLGPAAIAGSRMLPLRFAAAFEATRSLTYGRELEAALNFSLANVPALAGRTLVLCDVSGSMDGPISARSAVKRLSVAAVFSAALALRAVDATLVAFSNDSTIVPVRPGQSVLLTAARLAGSLPHGATYTWSAVKEHFHDHDRVIIVTDEQPQESYGNTVLPETTRLYVFNVAGYAPGSIPSGRKNRYAFGGLSDAGFTAIEMLERGSDQAWPF